MQNVSICNAPQSSGGNAYHHLGKSTYFGSDETRLHKSIREKVLLRYSVSDQDSSSEWMRLYKRLGGEVSVLLQKAGRYGLQRSEAGTPEPPSAVPAYCKTR